MRGICVHGHFYQPPRENPWLEHVEAQESAGPYHDWNERVAEECYAPNAAARVLDDEGLIVALVNNYARMSFDFGPTLLGWLERRRPPIYEAILEADAESARRCGGHGGAMAQAYHHLIMPLANARDRHTQVRWGVEDFRHRFGRDPEGMWLPETAADTPSLEALAAEGIRFTVLAPRQARRWRRLGDGAWVETTEGVEVDPGRPYRVSLPSGRSIAVFFYSGALSRQVAFDGLLRDGSALAEGLYGALSEEGGDRLLSIATDGETYGHHHRFGDMALAYALRLLEQRDDVRLTNYAEYLAEHPPEHEAELLEPGSWSCAHGVERWRSDCGCHTGGESDWDQAWRAPLRDAFVWLRDRLVAAFEAGAEGLLADPWAARDDYVRVLLERSDEARQAFLSRHVPGPLQRADEVRVWKLLELQRQAMMMFTSCGWFFSDVAGIESRQVLQYAGRAVQLARTLDGPDLEAQLLERLARARSNRPAEGDAADIYRRVVEPARVGLGAICANWAIDRRILDNAADGRFYCYDVESLQEERAETGRALLSAGTARVTSHVTRDSELLAYGVLHLGDHQLQAGAATVSEAWAEEEFQAWAATLREAWDRADLMEVRDVLRRRLGRLGCDLRTMFHDERQAVLETLLEDTLEEIETEYRQVWERHAPLMRYLAGLDVPVSRALGLAAGYVLEADLHQLLQAPSLNAEAIRLHLEELQRWGVEADQDRLVVELERAADSAMRRVMEEPDEPDRLRDLATLVTLARGTSEAVNLWRVQNDLVRLRDARLATAREAAAAGDGAARRWIEELEELGRLLSVRV